MNNLAFQIYGTKKATPFQSVWKTDTTTVGTEQTATLTASAPATNWELAPGGTSLLTGGYTHSAGSTANLLFSSLAPVGGQTYRMQYTITGTGSVRINFGGVSSDFLSAGTNVIITLTAIDGNSRLSLTPSSDFVGNIRLSIKARSSEANQINLPISIATGKSVWVDWGDNSYSNMSSTTGSRLHTYSTPGEYAVRILGDDFTFRFGFTSTINDRLKLRSISSWGKLKIVGQSFLNCSNVTMSGITDIPDLTGITSLDSTFYGCSEITTIGRINEWNTSLVTITRQLFRGCTKFNSNIGSWNVSNVTNMIYMFYYASAFNQPIGFWNVSNVTDFQNMFESATAFNNGFASGIVNQLPWNTSNVTNMSYMFQNAIAFNSNLGTGATPWNVSKVTTFQSMFQGASKFNNGNDTAPINNWNIGESVTGTITLESMFSSASAFNRDISGWDVSKVNTLSGIFANAINFENGLNTNRNPVTYRTGLDGWNIVVTKNMYGVFLGASKFNRPLSNWNTTSVTWMLSMFQNATSFNQDISSWNVGNVTNMGSMFLGAGSFNQNIGNWNVTKVTNFQNMFQSASAFNNNGSSDIDNWDINTTLGANVNMRYMFGITGSFNQPLNNWNTSEVINMSAMFSGSLFNNGELPGVAGTLVWNTVKVTDMSSMFAVNSRFNCNIGSWDVRNVTTFNNMFREASAFNNGGDASINTWILKETGDIDMTQMFHRAPNFNQPVGGWNVGRVTSMQEMFSAVSTTSIFNQDISSWNVSRVNNMAGMFSNAGAFNKSLSDWERVGSTLSNVTTMNQMFFNATAFNNGELPGVASTLTWNTIGVGDMGQMFDTATAFNCDIGGFNVSNCASFGFMFRGSSQQGVVPSRFNNGGSSSIGSWILKSTGSITMRAMFNRATAFNQPIGSWNTSRVTSMQTMFSGATAFNQNIGSWNVSNVTNFSGFMETKTPVTGTSPFSSTNLDAIYNGWIVNGVKPNTSSPLSINISFGSAKYSQAGKLGRDTLLASPNNWRITDGLLTVSGTSSSGGVIRVTTPANGFTIGTSVLVNIYGVNGTTNANGTWTALVISSTVIQLQGSNYNGAWTGGGNVILG